MPVVIVLVVIAIVVLAVSVRRTIGSLSAPAATPSAPPPEALEGIRTRMQRGGMGQGSMQTPQGNMQTPPGGVPTGR